MKKKIIKMVPVVILLMFVSSGCVNVWEDVWIEHIPRPVVEIDSISVPPWDDSEIIIEQ